jgi:hypothetical protein
MRVAMARQQSGSSEVLERFASENAACFSNVTCSSRYWRASGLLQIALKPTDEVAVTC